MRRSVHTIVGALVASSLISTGCVDRIVAGQTIALLDRSAAAIEQESDPDLAFAAAAAGIKQLEGFYVAYGGDRRMLPVLARATCGYAAGYLQDRWEAATLDGDRAAAATWGHEARQLLGRCAAYALRGLAPGFAALIDGDDAAAARALAGARAADAPLLYWLGTALAVAIGIAPDDLALAAMLPRATAILTRVVELDDGIDHGGGHVTLGILLAAQSAAVGGDPERGRAHLERAVALTDGRGLLAPVMTARIYAVTTRDRALFERLLREVLATSPAVWPEQRLANELAQRRARRYLQHRRRWFPDAAR
ncbi:MAG: hypothetical protein H6708_19445 [Kofleriaceae bacterium]|nr:hypothetical protein [Kofleriaceae bacterium]